jgi:phage gpG-like protein
MCFAKRLLSDYAHHPKTKKALRFKVAGKWVMKQKVVMPKRQYLGWTDQDEKTAINMVLEFLQKETQA